MSVFSTTAANHQPGGIPYLGSEAVEQIRSSICAGSKLHDGRESESCGLLVMAAGSAVVDGVRPIRSAYRFGRGRQISSNDRETVYSAVKTLAQDQCCAGFYRATYDDFKLTADDLTVAEMIPNCRLIVLAEPLSDDRCTLRLFRPGPVAGSWSPYDQFEAPLADSSIADPPPFQEPRVEARVEPRTQQRPALPALPSRERTRHPAALIHPAPAELAATAGSHAPHVRMEIPFRQREESPRTFYERQNSIRAQVIVASCGAVLVLLAAALVWKNLPPRRTEPVGVGNLGLRVEAQGNLLHLSWNRSAPEVQRAKLAKVLIQDGSLRREVDLEGSDIAVGSVSYPPVSDSVRFEFQIPDTNPLVSEHIWVIDGLRPAGAANPKVARSVDPPATRYPPVERPQHQWVTQPPGDADRLRDTTPGETTTAVSGTVLKTHEAVARTFVPPSRSTPATTSAADLEPPAVTAVKAEPASVPSLAVPALTPPRLLADSPRLAETRTRTAPPLTVVPAIPIRKSSPNMRGLGTAAFSRETSVQVRVVIDATGLVVRANVEKANPGTPQGIIQASLDAAREWRFQPATSGGRPVQSEHTVVFNFKPVN